MPKADSPPATIVTEQVLDIKSSQISSDLSSFVESAKQRFIDRNPNSKRLFDEACGSLPGGNTRTLLYSAPFPICMKKGEHYQVIDEDDHVYVLLLT